MTTSVQGRPLARLAKPGYPDLGMVLRAARLGFWWTGTCFLRISGSGPFRCDVRPCELIGNHDKLGGKHWVWWESAEVILKMLPLNQVRCKRPFTVYVNDLGETV